MYILFQRLKYKSSTCKARSKSGLGTSCPTPSKFLTKWPANSKSFGVTRVNAVPFSPARPDNTILVN